MSEPQSDAGEQTGTPFQLQILTQYVKDLSFENPNAPQSLLPNEAQPGVGITVDVEARQIAEEVFEVVLELKAEAKQGDKVAFIVELSYGGLFQIPAAVSEEHHAPMLLIEGARLLFPFARSVIAGATRDGGYPPLLVNPVDFVDLFRRRVAAAQEASNAAAAPNGAAEPF